MLTRRLYLQIYATIIASIVTVTVLSGVLWNTFGRDRIDRDMFQMGGRLISLVLPAADVTREEQRQAINRLGRELDADLSLFDAAGQLIAAVGDPTPPPTQNKGGWRAGHGGPFLNLRLNDGRWLVVNMHRRGAFHPLVNLILFLGSIALCVGIVSYPFVRRLTRRLERLQSGVERIGTGDLSTRIKVEGRDEVAHLAQSFNEAAAKIEKLLEAHRLLLANASHELRTPLARIRLGIDMLKEREDPARRRALQRDIAELDLLIDEIMLMSRLDAGSELDRRQAVDLVALAAEECAHFDHCSLKGKAPELTGDPHLLRRLIRNLLNNAIDHGAPPIEVEIEADKDTITLTVSDCGPGIAEENRERVFQPFYRGPDRQNVEGYGLGLPLVRQIAEAHGGTAEVSLKGRLRSSISVTLPIDAGKRGHH